MDLNQSKEKKNIHKPQRKSSSKSEGSFDRMHQKLTKRSPIIPSTLPSRLPLLNDLEPSSRLQVMLYNQLQKPLSVLLASPPLLEKQEPDARISEFSTSGL